MDKPTKLFLRPAEAAAMISVSRSKIYEMIEKGELPATRFGSSLRIPTEVIERRVREVMGGSSDENAERR
jgi:excisionase family DNA binding protein